MLLRGNRKFPGSLRGMVRQWQDMVYEQHRSCSDLSDPTAVKNPNEQEIYPNFLKIAEGYRVKAERVSAREDLAAAYRRLLANANEPYLLDIIVEAEENVYPMILAGGTYQDIIMTASDLLSAKKSQGSNV